MTTTSASDDNEPQFAKLVEAFTGIQDVERSKRKSFGGGALTFQDSIFAMLVRGRLVVKLPEQRVNALINDELGHAFDANRGKPMKQWFVVRDQQDGLWRLLAEEALAYARSSLVSKGKRG